MGDPISLIYIYGNYSEDKIADPERYGDIDVVYDAYSMVLKDIPDGKTVNFSVKVFLPDGVKELVLGSDSDVLHMFHDDDQFVDKQVGDETVGDETVRKETLRDEVVRDEDIGDEEMGDDDSVDYEWGKDSNEVGDDDSTNSEKDLEIDEDTGGVVDSDGKLLDCKSDDSPDKIDYWVKRNIDQTEKGKMRVGLIFADVHAFRTALKDYMIEEGIEILRAKNEKKQE
ncbi:hypothetical protein NE237_009322 [Protea cynaroides]|uniref:Uncharacterized protein n=1 Tax=Protea cynaroides TaxID=273540 RepID=A0A9Q0KXI8_9MAGN|nr:hypothetical protein NE237_009322 [Protea cynaroides]